MDPAVCKMNRAPGWMTGPEVVCAAVRLILDGALDGGVENDLASECGVSGRHLRRLCNDFLGLTPAQFARVARLRRGIRMLRETDRTIAEIAYEAGFGSVRQFNRVCQDNVGQSPTKLRTQVNGPAGPDLLTLPLPPLDSLHWRAFRNHMARWAIPGVEHVSRSVYRRTVAISGRPGAIELSASEGGDRIQLRVDLPDWRQTVHVVQRARHLLHPEHGLAAGVTTLPADRTAFRQVPSVSWVPGAWDPFEMALTAVLSDSCPVRM